MFELTFSGLLRTFEMPGITLVTEHLNGLPRVTLPNSKIIFKDNHEISLFHNPVRVETYISFICYSYCIFKDTL